MSEVDTSLELLSINRASKELKIGRNRIYELIENGELGVIEFSGGKLKIPRSDLIRCIKEKTRYTVPNGSKQTVIEPFNASTTILRILKGGA